MYFFDPIINKFDSFGKLFPHHATLMQDNLFLLVPEQFLNFGDINFFSGTSRKSMTAGYFREFQNNFLQPRPTSPVTIPFPIAIFLHPDGFKTKL